MKLIDYIVVIPARFDSKRLPGKALLDIAGKTLIEHVFVAASKSQAREIIIATDSEKIKKVAENFNAKTVMTRTDHRSGTDRIAELAEIENWKEDQIVVNVQGDCPLMPPENIDQVASLLFKNRDAGIATLQLQSFKSRNEFAITGLLFATLLAISSCERPYFPLSIA